MVVNRRSRRHAYAAGSVERQAHTDACLRRRAQSSCAAGAGSGNRYGALEAGRKSFEQEVVVFAVAHVEANAVREDAHDEPTTQQRLADAVRLVQRKEEKVGAGGQRLESEGSESACHALSFL